MKKVHVICIRFDYKGWGGIWTVSNTEKFRQDDSPDHIEFLSQIGSSEKSFDKERIEEIKDEIYGLEIEELCGSLHITIEEEIQNQTSLDILRIYTKLTGQDWRF